MTKRQQEATLPTSCAVCVYYAGAASRCQRHAPAVSTEEFELVYWPKVRPDDRCGEGAAMIGCDGPELVACGSCMHWLRPDDQPVQPEYRQGLSLEWWKASGYCTHSAPTPSIEEDRRSFWRVTHAEAGCGAGKLARRKQTKPAISSN